MSLPDRLQNLGAVRCYRKNMCAGETKGCTVIRRGLSWWSGGKREGREKIEVIDIGCSDSLLLLLLRSQSSGRMPRWSYVQPTPRPRLFQAATCLGARISASTVLLVRGLGDGPDSTPSSPVREGCRAKRGTVAKRNRVLANSVGNQVDTNGSRNGDAGFAGRRVHMLSRHAQINAESPCVPPCRLCYLQTLKLTSHGTTSSSEEPLSYLA